MVRTPSVPPGPCINCAKPYEPKYFRKGRCGACYQYKLNHGVDRLIGAVPCLLCEKPIRPKQNRNDPRDDSRRGYCWACYVRLRRRGLLPLVRRSPKTPPPGPQPCTYCGLVAVLNKQGWCRACRDRQRRNGGNLAGGHPKYPPNCLNCGALKTSAKDRRLGAKGLCYRCYKYQQKLGHPRPEHCWKVA
jgi:hypothetical protein